MANSAQQTRPEKTANHELVTAGLHALVSLLARQAANEWLAAHESDTGSASDRSPR